MAGCLPQDGGGLHRLYDEVAREPIPDELLKLIEADRQK